MKYNTTKPQNGAMILGTNNYTMFGKLFILVFGKRKDGKCWWWEHEMKWEHHEEMRNVGTFLDGKPLQRKWAFTSGECTKCKHHEYGMEWPTS